METTTATTQLSTGTAVRASINERKFFESMKHLFATSFSLIGELMQNARRAGAYNGFYYGPAGQQEYAIINEIRARAKGFPLPVSINGQECPRPHAQDQLQGVMTPIGFVSYRCSSTKRRKPEPW